jgi:glycosyltransferase involved in cell wall biosynthesis
VPNRLLICTPSYALHGGVERIIESLAAGLPARGFDVVAGLARGRRFHDPDRYRAAYPELNTVDIDGTSGRAPDRVRALMKTIESTDPDIVLISRIFEAYSAASQMKMRGHRLRLAVTVQAWEVEYFVDAAVFAPFLDLAVTSGELIRRGLEQLAKIPSDRIVSIPGGVAPARRLRRRTIPSAPLRIGYVGRVESLQKRILDLPPLLLELRRRGIPFTCAIVGTGAAEGELRAAIEAAGLGTSVTMHGWLSTEELYENIYPELDIVIHFAEWEGITIAPREAMAHGAVPVVSRFPGLKTERQFVEGQNALTFPIGDISAAADAIERLEHDPGLLDRLSAAAAASQTGVRSAKGAVDAWADSFLRMLSMPQRVGTTLPATPRESGRLSWLPESLASALRRIAGKRMEHKDPGSEWPHSSYRDNPTLAAAFRELVDR